MDQPQSFPGQPPRSSLPAPGLPAPIPADEWNQSHQAPTQSQQQRGARPSIGPKDASFRTQFGAAVSKNILLKKTQVCSTCCETSLPIIFILLSVLIWLAVGESTFETRSFLHDNETFLNTSMLNLAVCVDQNESDIPGIASCPPAEVVPLTCFERNAPWMHIDNLCTLVPNPWLLILAFMNTSNARRVPTMDEMILAQMIARGATGGKPDPFWNAEGASPEELTMKMAATMAGGTIYVSPDNDVTHKLVDHLNATSTLFRYVWGGFFKSEADAMSKVTHYDRPDKYIWGVIQVNDLSATGFDVTIRLNRSALTWSDRIIDNIYNGGMEHDLGITYISSGFLTLQKAITEYYISEVLNSSVPTPEPVMAWMPYPEFKSWDFLVVGAKSGYIALFLVLSYLYTVSQICKSIVIEKETRVREAMKIMGLSNVPFYTSWFFTYGIEVLVATLASTVISALTYFKHINIVPLFLLYFLFGLSCIALATILSSFFNKARIAALVTPVLFVLLSIPMFMVNNWPLGLRIILLLVSPSAMAQGASLMANHEIGGGMSIGDMVSASDDINMLFIIIALLFDTALYMFLAVYFDLVLPSEWGMRKHPLFCILDCFKKPAEEDEAEEELSVQQSGIMERGDSEVLCDSASHRRGGSSTIRRAEEYDPDLSQLRASSSTFFESTRADHNPVTVRLKKLVKKFDRDDGAFVAVDHLSLNLRENEINVLLGHNGAGKTTTINMMTGMLDIDGGDCTVYGHSTIKDIVGVRHEVGLCPQHNILWPELTCDQHLRFFGKLKGLADQELENAIADMLAEVDLAEKRHELAGALSGGQLRKLSVAIAFIGGSRLVILDEPTAGMDVAARRHTWDLIKRLAQGRTILLTTHFMDEADLLGHCISIMSKGKLRCQGSSSFLKAKLGVGYTLSLSLDPSVTNREPLHDFVMSKMRDAIPVQGGTGELAFTLPVKLVPFFPAFFEVLEREGPDFGMRDIGLSMTTLEEVFLRIATEEETQEEQFTEDASGPAKREYTVTRGTKLPKIWEDSISGDEEASSGSQLWALSAKRLHYFKRDRRSLCLQITTPICCIIFAFLLSELNWIPDTPSLSIGAEMYKQDHVDEMRVDTANCAEYLDPSVLSSMYRHRDLTNDTPTAVAFDQYLRETFQSQDPDRYISMFCNETTSIANEPYTLLYHNGSAYHTRPEVLQLYYKGYIETHHRRSGTTPPPMTLASHVMDWTHREQAMVQSGPSILIAIFVIIPFTFIPSTYAAFIVKERETKAKHLQLVSGMRFTSYWLANLIADIATYSITITLCMIAFAILGRDEYIGSGETVIATILVFLFYGISSIPMTYAFSFAFDEHSSAQNVVMMVNFICGFALTLAISILRGFDSTEKLADGLGWICRAIPPYALGEGVIRLNIVDLQRTYGIDKSPFDFDDGVGYLLIYMSLELPIFFILTLVLDRPGKKPTLANAPPVPPPKPEEEDNDVHGERQRIENWTPDPPGAAQSNGTPHSDGYYSDKDAPPGLPAQDAVIVQRLSKVYSSNGKVAVKNVSFGVHKGEVFGFLGTNGAGKTTTIAILCGEHHPTFGSAYVHGLDVVANASEAQKHIGYCPQFDALLGLLTAEEHLNLFAGLRGYTGEGKKKIVTSLMTIMGLHEHATTVASALSGGNKRKLSVALSLVGHPRVVFLDEPSAGMDPVARRRLWTVIQDMSTQCAIVLTTHHLEEVEALAHRIAIMSEGELKCIGDKTHLKTKFGTGYEMSLRCSSQRHADQCHSWLRQAIPESKIIEYRNLRTTVALPQSTRLSRMFHLLNENRQSLGIRDFSLSQTSIEQVFLRFATTAEE